MLSLVAHVGAAPDAAEVDAQLQRLDFQHNVEIAEILKPIDELTAKYKQALEQQRERFQAAGNLEGVLVVARDLAAIEAGKVGEESHESDPAEVVRLREIFLRESASSSEPLARAQLRHAARLDELTAQLTQAGNFEQAVRVREISEEVKAAAQLERPVTDVRQATARPPEGMVLVEGGTMEMSIGTKTVESFYIGSHEVTWGEWQRVRRRARALRYDLVEVGQGNANDHPVISVSWYDVVKWCNLKSEQ